MFDPGTFNEHFLNGGRVVTVCGPRIFGSAIMALRKFAERKIEQP